MSSLKEFHANDDDDNGGLLARDKSKRKLEKGKTTNATNDNDEDKENVQHRGA
jgi:hypothetical protein